LLAIALFFGKETKPFFKENPFVTVVAVIIILVAIYFLVRYSLDRRIKMVINKEGIWTPKKGLLVWSNVQYYYFEEIQTDNATVSLLKIKLLKPSKEVKIDIAFFNKSERDIEDAIKDNSGDYNIIALKVTY